jgi:hypothetical protein
MPNVTVLVIATDEMIAALLSTMVDFAGGHAVFARADEHALTAMDRLRPDIVLLEANGDVRDEALFQATSRRVAEIGAVLRLFSPSRDEYDVAAIARQRRVPAFALPVGLATFKRLLSEAATESTARRAAQPMPYPTESRGTDG